MNNQIFAGVDVGGTNTKVGLLADDGQIVCNTQFPTQQSLGAEYALKLASEAIHSMMRDSSFQDVQLPAVGLAVPGPIDIAAGKVLDPFNLPGWGQSDVRDMLAKYTGRPVCFTNDANAAALGEFWIGTGIRYSSLILITLGTGVGGGIILDSHDIVGAHSHAAEFGHVIIDRCKNARICSCGNPGHLEAYASATALVRRCREAIKAGSYSVLKNVPDEKLTALNIYETAAAGDPLAIKLIDETADYLGTGIVSLVHVIDPEVVLLGGAMTFGGKDTAIGKKFLNDIRCVVENCSLPAVAQNLKIEYASLGGDAGFVGAAYLARRDYQLSQTAAVASS